MVIDVQHYNQRSSTRINRFFGHLAATICGSKHNINILSTYYQPIGSIWSVSVLTAGYLNIEQTQSKMNMHLKSCLTPDACLERVHGIMATGGEFVYFTDLCLCSMQVTVNMGSRSL